MKKITNIDRSKFIPRKLKNGKFDYRDGGRGMIQWCEDNVCLSITPKGKTVPEWILIRDFPPEFRGLWEWQCEKLLEALEMKDGRFIYRQIVFCLPRAYGKSLMTVLTVLWKFLNFPRQTLVLGANSKDQVGHVHLKELKDIVLNSPKVLRIIGKRNLQDKEIRLTDKNGNVVSKIRIISTHTGLLSNITGYTFSEFFLQSKFDFYTALDGSLRGQINALGIIDTTASHKAHMLYKLYKAAQSGKDKTIYFCYETLSPCLAKNHPNPNITQAELDSYEIKFTPPDFAMYFKNLWSGDTEALFSQKIIESMKYIGVDGRLTGRIEIQEIVKKIIKAETLFDNMTEHYQRDTGKREALLTLKNSLYRVDDIYKLRTSTGIPQMALLTDLGKLEDLYDTNFAIICGCDRADPAKVEGTSAARTIITLLAKGLPGSRSRPFMLDENTVPNYIYFILHMAQANKNELNEIKNIISLVSIEYDGINSFCAERWGFQDFNDFSDNIQMPTEIIHPSQVNQRSMFNELYSLAADGRLKTPIIGIHGSKTDNILEEELKLFTYDIEKKWYGSPEKKLRYGVQDDSIFSLALAIHGGRNLIPEDFRSRDGNMFFGQFYSV